MQIDTEIVKIKLDALLNKRGSFCICDLRDIGDLIGTNVRMRPQYKRLQALHCVDYADMSKDLLDELPSMVMACLTARYNTDLMAKALMAVHTNEINSSTEVEDRELVAGKVVKLLR